MSKEGEQEKKECMKVCKKNNLNNLLKKTIENDELQSVEVDVIINFIKHKVESFSDAEVYTGDNEEDRIIGFR